jgi:6-phosphogluconolactonase
MSKVRHLEVRASQARRGWLKSVSALAAMSAMGSLAAARPAQAASAAASTATKAQTAEPLFAYVGTYTPNGLGIHRFQVDRNTGKLDALEPLRGIENPSCLVVDRQQRFLFAVSEVKNYNGTKNGSVSAYAIEPGTGSLHLINTVNSQGAGPVYLSLHPNGRFLLVANYNSGSIAVFRWQATARWATPVPCNSRRLRQVRNTRQKASLGASRLATTTVRTRTISCLRRTADL